MVDSVERVLKIGIWITATVLFCWIWYYILTSQSFFSGLGFNSLLLLVTMVFFYYLKQLLHLEFNLSKTIDSGSVIIQIPKGLDSKSNPSENSDIKIDSRV